MDLKASAEQLSHVLDLEADPVGVFLLSTDGKNEPFVDWKLLERHRYCEAMN